MHAGDGASKDPRIIFACIGSCEPLLAHALVDTCTQIGLVKLVTFIGHNRPVPF